MEQYRHVTKSRILKKLNKIYGGQIKLPEEKNNRCYINLSHYQPTENEEQLLNIGINCHIKKKFDPLEKATELELLYCSIIKLENDGIVRVNKNLRDLLRAESTKHRDYNQSKILNQDLQNAAKSLRTIEDIIIRKADKANIFVILNKSDYKEKLDKILNDKNKFVQLSRDTTADLKITVNKYITNINKEAKKQILTPISGEFAPGYIYGNVKTQTR